MWEVETYVDLGDVSNVAPQLSRPGVGVDSSPDRWTRWTRSRRIALRRVWWAVPLVALLSLVAAAQAAPASPLRLVARVPVGIDATVMVHGSALYVYETSGLHNGITAYEVDTGERLWSATTLEIAALSTMRYVDGYVIVSMVDTDSVGQHTIALDPRTGREAWTSDLGLARPAAGGVLVEAMSRPPGFNYPGTPSTGLFSLLDSQTGRPRWTYPILENCITAFGDAPANVPVTTLVELCPNSSTLSLINVADGHAVAVRHVELGDPDTNFELPAADQLDTPRLVVTASAVLVAHADQPTPTVDAYAVGDLRPLWTGVPFTGTDDLQACDPYVCVYGAGALGVRIDATTGRDIGVAPPIPPGPDEGSFVLLGVDRADPMSDRVAISSAADGLGVPLVPPGALPAQPAIDAWLATWHAGPSSAENPAGGFGSPIELLRSASAPSCAAVAAYLACTSTPGRLTVWRIRR
jgi:hypothetical protein